MGKYISQGRRFLTDQGLATSSAKFMPAGTVLFSSRAPIGYVAIAANPVTTSQGFRSFIPSDEIDSEYLYYVLKFIKPMAEQLASGTTFAELSGSKAARLPIAYPSLAEQATIARALSEAEQSSRRASARLLSARRAVERFRHALLAAASSGRLTSDVRGEAELESDLPRGWRWTTLDEVCEKVTVGHVGKMVSEYQPDGIPFLRSLNIRELRFDPKDLRFVSRRFHQQLKKSALRPGDIVVVRSGNVGTACVIPPELAQANCSDLLIARPGPELLPGFGAIYLNSPKMKAHVSAVKVGSAQPHFNTRALQVVRMPLPPMDEQHEIVRRVDSFLAIADGLLGRITMASHRVAQGAEAILKKAFRGELAAPSVR